MKVKPVPFETGRYIICGKLPAGHWNQEAKRFISILLIEEYGGWSQYHCTDREGARGLYLKQEGKKFICRDGKFEINSVVMISGKEYLKELGLLHVPAPSQKKRK